jgi:glycosyltransferase involved in cell wall biosynthesis
LANAFVHASTTEQWGLVVNEAMASGLPVIVSNRCGCAPELVKDEVNGYSFDPENDSQLAARLSEMAALPQEQRESFGEASRQIVADFGPERFAQGLLHASEKALEIGPRKPGLFQRALLRALIRR